MNQSFHIDVNTTKSCNLRCTYCFEAKDEMSKEFSFTQTEALIQFVKDFMKTSEFTSQYSDLAINFWGGEPTLNKELFTRLVDEFEHNPKVRFFMYTNGFNISQWYIDKFKDLQKIRINGHPKIVIQISYDGQPIHDVNRITANDKGSADQVKATIANFKKQNVFHVLKSTIAPENFKHLYEAYLDVTSVGDGYFPTIDLHKEYENEEEYKKYGQDLYENLIKIAVYEKKMKKDQFRWFMDSRSLCSAGTNMIAIDLNGNILPCHGALYTNYDEHLFCNLTDIGALEKVINKLNWYKTFFRNEPEGCKQCTDNFCLRCNIVKYEYSKKDTYEERWTDHNSQPYLCYFFDILNIVTQSKRSL